jgi:diaminohydroxyphosphoribosylaminopyrimidine deaminase/5-amino-6-(5-phosphoribosylamino)uracil reductase
MDEARTLAERGRGRTRPNPVVGAVVVRGGRVLATGYHHRAGLPHAEVDALAKLDFQAKGATLYVTLEPCCHTGRTGPCTEAILRAGIKRVVVGCCDENPLVSGRGVRRLRQSGVQVDVGCREAECRTQNRAFFRWIRDRRPWVTLKVASTLDGFIGDRQDKKRGPTTRWITGKTARGQAHILRAQHDAMLVGVGTVLADDPQLTVRLPGKRTADPLRVVLDGHLRTPPKAKLLSVGTRAPLIVGALPRGGASPALRARRSVLEAAGAEVVLLPADAHGRILLPGLLDALGEREIQSLLVEGGSRVHGAFVAERLVDSVAAFFAPRLVGGGVPIVEGAGLDWRTPIKLGPLAVRAVGDDILVVADVVQPSRRS